MESEQHEKIQKKFAELHCSGDGLSSSEATKRLEQYGSNALTEEKQSKLKKLLKTVWGPIPWLIEIAAILSLVIQHYLDFAVIAALLIFNSLIEFVQSNKASNALAALKSSIALKARVKRDGKWQAIPARELVPGDITKLEIGDIVPADCLLVAGDYLLVDQSVLTGESLATSKKAEDKVYSGSIIKQGAMDALVVTTGAKTYIGRTATLTQTAGRTSSFQRSVIAIGKFLIVGALLFAVLIIAKELYDHENPLMIVELVLVLVIASIPVAMPAVLSVTMALGALQLSKQKAIVSRLQSIEELAGVDVLCSDKTGTLTKNELTFGEPILYEAKSLDELHLMAALACSLDSKDLIDATILKGVSQDQLSLYHQEKFTPFDPISKKSSAIISINTQRFTVVKGAPQVIIAQCKLSSEEQQQALADVEKLATRGFRALGIAKTDAAGEFHLLGIVSLYDPPRDDSKQVIADTKSYGIQVKMITGDNIAIGREVARELNLGSNLQNAKTLFPEDADMDHLSDAVKDTITRADGFAEVTPADKYGIVKSFQQQGRIVAMTGDGVNDAPALKQADVGIAVSGATDAARNAADLILTLPGLSVITHAIKGARKIFERMISYISYRVTMTINIMAFVTLSILLTNVVPLTPIMIVLLALLDDIPIIAIAYDHTKAQQSPVKWQLTRVLSVAAVLGLVSVAENFGLMHIAKAHLVHDFSHIQTIMFLQLVVAGHLLLFISRHKSWFWLRPWPSLKLVVCIVGTQIIAVAFCKAGILMPAISWKIIGIVWLYAIGWMFVLNVVRIVVNRSFESSHEQFRFTGSYTQLK